MKALLVYGIQNPNKRNKVLLERPLDSMRRGPGDVLPDPKHSLEEIQLWRRPPLAVVRPRLLRHLSVPPRTLKNYVLGCDMLVACLFSLSFLKHQSKSHALGVSNCTCCAYDTNKHA
ncbi:hypothetical protein MRX96_034829 [Rhipicephalus microplus]